MDLYIRLAGETYWWLLPKVNITVSLIQFLLGQTDRGLDVGSYVFRGSVSVQEFHPIEISELTLETI